MKSKLKIFGFGKWWLIAGALAAAGLNCWTSWPATAQTPEAHSGFRDCRNCPEMVVLPSGSFMMGSAPDETARDIEEVPKSDASSARKLALSEQPEHEVTLNLPFALAKFPVTKNEFAAFVEETGYIPTPGCILYALQYHLSPHADWRFPGFVQTDREPAVCLNWQDAKAFIGWLNKKTANSTNSVSGGLYRLPSEAEWEYAARSGTRTTRWWGDAIGRDNTDCARCGSKWDQMQTAPVGSFRPNPFGLYDLLGNVSQWTEDCWNDSYVDAPVDSHPWTTGNCERRVARGGNWNNLPWVVRSATRSGFNAEGRYNYVGFRVAKTIGPSSR